MPRDHNEILTFDLICVRMVFDHIQYSEMKDHYQND